MRPAATCPALRSDADGAGERIHSMNERDPITAYWLLLSEKPIIDL
jgi:hypothetical protein